MGKMVQLFEHILAKKPSQGESPTGSRKRQSTEHNNDSDREQQLETSSGRSSGKRQRRKKSPDTINIFAGDSEDEFAKLVGTAGKNTDGEITKTRGNEPLAQEHDFLVDLDKGLSDEESTGPHITQKLADIVLKRWGKQWAPKN